MKKLVLFISVYFIISIVLGGTISKTYNIGKPIIHPQDGFASVYFANSIQSGIAGQPSIPYLSISLLIPPGEEAVSITFKGKNLTRLEGEYTLYPYQPNKPLSDTTKSDFLFDDNTYSLSTVYPKDAVGGLSTYFINGHSIAMSTFSPLLYTPSLKEVSYYTSVTVTIETKTSEKAITALDNLSSKKIINDKILRVIQNPESLNRYNNYLKSSDSAYSLLIVTGAQYIDEMDNLRDIYLSRGIVSEVAAIEDINSSGAGQDLPEKLRNFIIQEYQNKQIEFVLLGGDVEIIPYRGFYCYVQSGAGYTSNDIPADLYYSALDGSWNDDGDNHWGEPDEDDLLPEIAVARLPFSNSSELSKMIHKSISYQNNPVLGEFTNPLLAGENLYSNPDTWGRDYLDLLIGEHTDNGYTTIGIPDTYSIDSIYEYHAPWGGNTIMSHINQGKQMVHHVGHASPSYVAHMYSSDITNSNFSGANGVDHNYTIFHTHGCDCGSFDNDDCILEKMVIIDNFAVAVVGNSRFGWFNEGQTEGPAAHLHREMTDAFFNDQINKIGLAMVESKIETAPWVEAPGQHEEGALRWNFYDLNILGDPALSVWTSEPIDINVDCVDEVEIGTPTMDVNVTSSGSPMENFTCTLIKENVLHATGNTDINGDVILTFDPPVLETGEAILITVGNNCLPDTTIVTFIPSGEAYVVYNYHIIVDTNENNNGNADYGELIYLDLAIKNQGVLVAENVNLTISTYDEFISIIDNSEYYGNINPDEIVMVPVAVSFQMSEVIPDGHIIEFELTCEGNGQTWSSDFEVVAFAPNPIINDFIIDDSNGGNGNNRLDPGESVTMQVEITNIGSSNCNMTTVVLESNISDVVINPDILTVDSINAGETKMAEFYVEVDNNVVIGTPVEFTSELDMCGYYFVTQFNNVIGLLIEDFETSDFSAFDWHFDGNGDWVITDIEPANGIYCSRSATIGDGQNTGMFISLTTANDDVITFSRKVSSEQNYDFLRFYIDGNKKGEWSGEQAWDVVSYELPAGDHELLWNYEKDVNSLGGNDCCWLDDIIFPPSVTIIDVNNKPVDNDIMVYPNPGTGIFNIKINSKLFISQIEVYNAMGSLVKVLEVENNSSHIVLDICEYNSGLYTLISSNSNTRIVKKVILN